jgi:hypothetical protein
VKFKHIVDKRIIRHRTDLLLRNDLTILNLVGIGHLSVHFGSIMYVTTVRSYLTDCVIWFSIALASVFQPSNSCLAMASG